MHEQEFSLVDEPWIKVMMPDCSVQEVSLGMALTEAHQYKGLAGEMAAQDVAVLRLLIAVVHTVFTQQDTKGEFSPVEDEKTALDRWDQLNRNGSFPEKPIRNYLDKWRDRFFLFDDRFQGHV